MTWLWKMAEASCREAVSHTHMHMCTRGPIHHVDLATGPQTPTPRTLLHSVFFLSLFILESFILSCQCSFVLMYVVLWHAHIHLCAKFILSNRMGGLGCKRHREKEREDRWFEAEKKQSDGAEEEGSVRVFLKGQDQLTPSPTYSGSRLSSFLHFLHHFDIFSPSPSYLYSCVYYCISSTFHMPTKNYKFFFSPQHFARKWGKMESFWDLTIQYHIRDTWEFTWVEQFGYLHAAVKCDPNRIFFAHVTHIWYFFWQFEQHRSRWIWLFCTIQATFRCGIKSDT